MKQAAGSGLHSAIRRSKLLAQRVKWQRATGWQGANRQQAIHARRPPGDAACWEGFARPIWWNSCRAGRLPHSSSITSGTISRWTLQAHLGAVLEALPLLARSRIVLLLLLRVEFRWQLQQRLQHNRMQQPTVTEPTFYVA